jgi:hypothetical protein
MALRFDPARTRKSFDSFMLKRELSDSREKYSVLGGASIMKLGTIINAWLVGLSTEITPALMDCHAWLKYSVDSKEPLGDVDIPATRSSALGLCHWMIYGENSVSTHRNALEEYEYYFKCGGQKVLGPDIFNKESQRFEQNIQRGIPVSDENILNGYLGDYLANCIQGEEYERGISLYERVGGEVNPGPKRMKNIREFGYCNCSRPRYGVTGAGQPPMISRMA